MLYRRYYAEVLVALSLLAAAIAQANEPSTATAAKRPNVLLIIADDLGYSDLGCYGGETQTPNLDRLAQNGLRFTQFYNTARCWPSRGALLTGYYAQQIRRDTVPGVKSGSQGVRPAWAKLLPEMLKPAGYRSYHSGKWHVDGPRLAGGFDRSFSVEDHDRYFAPRQLFEDDKKLPAVSDGSPYYVTTAIADYAIRFLREHAEGHGEQPFFTYLAFTAPHFPLQAPAADIDRCRHRYQVGWESIRRDRYDRMKSLGLIDGLLSQVERQVGPPYAFPEAIEKLGPGEVNRPLAWSELTAAQQEFQIAKMAVHAAMIERMDQEIGRVFQQLEAMKTLDNTLVLFMSDNGASAEIMVRGDGHDREAEAGSAATFLCLGPGWSNAANTPWRRHKTWVHEGGISTPLIAHWPRGIAARGELRRTPGHLIDLVPTILELAGGKSPAKVGDMIPPKRPGKSLVPTFASDTPVARDYLWWLHEGNRALRVGDWKIVAAGADAPWELYDFTKDRAEQQNLAEKMPEKVRELAALWSQARDQYIQDAAEPK